MTDGATTTTGTTGAATTSDPGTTGVTTTIATPAATWDSGFNDDQKQYVQTKGFKDSGMVLDSYRNLEKLLGVPQDRVLKLPEKGDDPAWSGIYDKLGRPKEAKDYGLKAPEKADPKMTEWAAAEFHKAGLSRKQAETIFNSWNGLQAANAEAAEKAYNAKVDGETQTLKTEWGHAYDQNIGVATKGKNALGLSDEHVDALEKVLGFAGTIKMLHSAGAKIGEDGFVTGDTKPNFSGKLTPSQARARIEALKADPDFREKYIAGNADAREEMNKLHQYMQPTG